MNQMNDEVIEWKNPDGKITKLNFDNSGKLIGKHSKETEPSETETETNTRYRYYQDLYGNQYRWTTHKQVDGKFHARILKLKSWHGRSVSKRYGSSYRQLRTTKRRTFTKKRSAIAWCLKAYLKAKEHQQNVINDRSIRKKRLDSIRLNSIPKQTKSQYADKKLKHYQDLKENLQKKMDTKIKTLKTRMETYQKKIKYYQKRKAILK